MPTQGRTASAERIADFNNYRTTKHMTGNLSHIVDQVTPNDIEEFCKILIEQNTSALCYRDDSEENGLLFYNNDFEVRIKSTNGDLRNPIKWDELNPANELLLEILLKEDLNLTDKLFIYHQSEIPMVSMTYDIYGASKLIKFTKQVGFWGGASLQQLQAGLGNIIVAAMYINSLAC